ncbi:hypothetical protein [Spartinivicinus poritis]|uniref:Glutathionylspermidine synthase pre-ATP-grasp-like domain-containing protein n=1 Tax=Spartinivicinus poritis TaxID=2994640 RepID=A0ABT5U7V1_9GAMM|nr:hypothetical protein [Spartinivicinus sp. A2-2]MDE1462453.1 hypothetical protein [Spartinivicinus sp. A2-2]
MSHNIDPEVIAFYARQTPAALKACADHFAQDLLLIHPGNWQVSFPPAIYPPEHLSNIGQTVQEILALVFSLPDRLFGGDYDALLEAQGLSPDYRHAIRPFCTPRLLERARLFARPDALLTQSGFKLVEMNVSPSLGGLGVCDRYLNLWHSNPLGQQMRQAGIQVQAPPMGERFGQLLKRHSRRLNVGTPPIMLELLDDPQENPRDNTGWPDFLDISRQSGFEVVTAWPSDVEIRDEGVFALGHRVDLIYTDFAYAEQRMHGIDDDFFAALVKAEQRQQVDLFSVPASCVVYENKANLALLSNPDHAAVFTDRERQLIQQHIPVTHILSESTMDQVLSERRDWVLKPALGLCGHEVVIGEQLTDSQWQAKLVTCLKQDEAFILQRHIKDLWTYQLPNFEHPRMVCLGPVILDGQFAGVFSREADYEGKAVVVNYARGAFWSSGLERVVHSHA